MHEAYPFLFGFENTEDIVIPRGGECNTPVLTQKYNGCIMKIM